MALVPTSDILSELAQRKQGQLLVGFSAETERVLENARNKIKAKKLDIMVVNDVTQLGAGFDSDTNIVTIIMNDGREIQLAQRSKREIADSLLDQIVNLKK